MKNFLCFMLKLMAVLAVLGAAAYAVVAYWDKITELYARVQARVIELVESRRAVEYADYQDWEQ